MSEPASSPETAEQKTPPETATPIDQVSSLRELAKLLSPDDKAPPAETPDGKKPTEKVKPKTLSEAAERLGLEVKDLYDLEIPSDKLEGLTLGKLKDHMVERENFTTRSLKFEEDAARKEADFERAKQELSTLLQALPANAVTPEVREQIRQRHEAALKLERERTLQAIPEWKDAKVRTDDMAGMVEHLTGFGFPPGYLAHVTDHRTLKFIRASWQRETRLRKALELVSEKKPGALGKSKDTHGAPVTPSRRPQSREEQEAARYRAALA